MSLNSITVAVRYAYEFSDLRDGINFMQMPVQPCSLPPTAVATLELLDLAMSCRLAIYLV